jgi:AraC-like DNA-binding protein
MDGGAQQGAETRECGRLLDWKHVVANAFQGCTVDAQDQRFDSSLSRCRIGSLDVTHVRAQRSFVQRWSEKKAASASGSVLLHLQVSGSCRTTQRRNDAVLKAGDAALCDPDCGYTIDFATPYEMFIIGLPLAKLCDHAPDFDLERLSGIKVDTSHSQLLLSFLQTAWTQRAHRRGDSAWEDCISRTGVDLVLRSFRSTKEAEYSSPRTKLQSAVLAYIKQNLVDPDLRVSAISQALGVSTRSVQFVFERMSTTASGFILDRRLDRAASLLDDPLKLGSITNVAFDCGFSDSAYFSRCFREHFGQPPREYRKRLTQSH